MRTCIVAVALVLSFGGRVAAVAEGEGGQIGNQPGSGFHTVLSSAMRYVMNYEQQFALLVSEEHYVQELQRPPNPGDNLSRSNPGGGMRAGGAMNIQNIKSDFVLVQLGMDGEGWMPFRDAFEVKGKKLRNREERLLKLFLENDKEAFEKAARINEASTKHHLGNVARTINIPTLGMMLLHPRVNERFEFTDGGEEIDRRPRAAQGAVSRGGAADVDQDHARARPGPDRNDLDRSVYRHGGEDPK